MTDPYTVLEHYMKLALDHSGVNYDPFEINDALDEIKARELRQQERLQTLGNQVLQLTKQLDANNSRISSLEERFN